MKFANSLLLAVAVVFLASSAAQAAKDPAREARRLIEKKTDQDSGILGLIAMVPSFGFGGRASGDFSTYVVPTGTQYVQFFVVQDGKYNDTIFFNVRRDRKNWWDADWIQGVKNGSVYRAQTHKKLFISRPNGAGLKQFYVIVVGRSDNPALKKKKKP